jgi:hypothetical protein
MSTGSILAKWRAQGSFVRFIDGNIQNCAAANLEWVPLQQALLHFDEWKVDWDMELTSEEIEIVRNPEWRAGLRFTPVPAPAEPAQPMQQD